MSSGSVLLDEIERLRGSLNRLWRAIMKTPIDRDHCEVILREVERSMTSIWRTVIDFVVDQADEHLKRVPGLYVQILSITGETPRDFIRKHIISPPYDFNPSKISSLIHVLRDRKYYSDERVRDEIASFVTNLNGILTSVYEKAGIRIGIQRITRFVSEFPEFSENWAISVCFLSALEIFVKKGLKEFGEKIEKEFKTNWRNLLRKLEEQGADIGSLQSALPEVFWKIRHKVIHEGYSPKDDELRIIEDSVRNLLSTIRNYLPIKP